MKLVAFDMDGTLVAGEGSWVKLHRYFGTLEIGNRNLEEYQEGKIDYAEFMARDLAAWPRAHFSQIKQVLLDYEFTRNALEACSKIKSRGNLIAIITSGIDLLAQDVSSKIKADICIANGLRFDSKGYLIRRGILRVDPRLKHLVLKRICLNLGIPLEETIAVGDSRYDSSFLKAAGLGIGYNPEPELTEIADVIIKDLLEILRFV